MTQTKTFLSTKKSSLKNSSRGPFAERYHIGLNIIFSCYDPWVNKTLSSLRWVGGAYLLFHIFSMYIDSISKWLGWTRHLI